MYTKTAEISQLCTMAFQFFLHDSSFSLYRQPRNGNSVLRGRTVTEIRECESDFPCSSNMVFLAKRLPRQSGTPYIHIQGVFIIGPEHMSNLLATYRGRHNTKTTSNAKFSYKLTPTTYCESNPRHNLLCAIPTDPSMNKFFFK